MPCHQKTRPPIAQSSWVTETMTVCLDLRCHVPAVAKSLLRLGCRPWSQPVKRKDLHIATNCTQVTILTWITTLQALLVRLVTVLLLADVPCLLHFWEPASVSSKSSALSYSCWSDSPDRWNHPLSLQMPGRSHYRTCSRPLCLRQPCTMRCNGTQCDILAASF